jgi:hypothetical protein
VIEDLQVKNMTASAAGTVEAPGKIARVRGANRSTRGRAQRLKEVL